ncbi:hypothetical protein [Vibrio alginolyticus]|uniref:hypothetical protein n=1 Tax=Vibrio TaxID=662 RepID=UPI0006CA7C55|nr:hypothetical protein [Vibrio alginolyticus]KPM97540.1 hypothetical protein AOG25_13805 [Vibrio alginolyticus]CAH7195546.1 conserved hypothetical protein [Vibrio chagasii]CAH7363273.1 conserved hypothetical protein [Vibrio chagasii]
MALESKTFSDFKQIENPEGNFLNFQIKSTLEGKTINFVALGNHLHIVSQNGAHIFLFNSAPSLTQDSHSELIEEMYKFVQAGDSIGFSRDMVKNVIDHAHKKWVIDSSADFYDQLPLDVTARNTLDMVRETVRSLTIEAANQVLDAHPNPYGFERIMEESYVDFDGVLVSIFKQDGSPSGDPLYEELGSCHKYDPVFQYHIEALHWVIKSLGETRTAGLELLLCRA